MENSYVISWKSRLATSFGQGKKLFPREEAERLAESLNEDHPDFIHEPLQVNPPAPDIAATAKLASELEAALSPPG